MQRRRRLIAFGTAICMAGGPGAEPTRPWPEQYLANPSALAPNCRTSLARLIATGRWVPGSPPHRIGPRAVDAPLVNATSAAQRVAGATLLERRVQGLQSTALVLSTRAFSTTYKSAGRRDDSAFNVMTAAVLWRTVTDLAYVLPAIPPRQLTRLPTDFNAPRLGGCTAYSSCWRPRSSPRAYASKRPLGPDQTLVAPFSRPKPGASNSLKRCPSQSPATVTTRYSATAGGTPRLYYSLWWRGWLRGGAGPGVRRLPRSSCNHRTDPGCLLALRSHYGHLPGPGRPSAPGRWRYTSRKATEDRDVYCRRNCAAGGAPQAPARDLAASSPFVGVVDDWDDPEAETDGDLAAEHCSILHRRSVAGTDWGSPWLHGTYRIGDPSADLALTCHAIHTRRRRTRQWRIRHSSEAGLCLAAAACLADPGRSRCQPDPPPWLRLLDPSGTGDQPRPTRASPPRHTNRGTSLGSIGRSAAGADVLHRRSAKVTTPARLLAVVGYPALPHHRDSLWRSRTCW